MKKKLTVLAAACFSAVTALSFTACGDGTINVGDKEVGERTQITFACDNDIKSEQAWLDLVADYNDGVGYEKDNVYVNLLLGKAAADSHFRKSQDTAYNVMMVADKRDSSFVSFAYLSHHKFCPNGYLLDLSDYAGKDADFQKNTIPDSVMDWWHVTFDPEADRGAGKKKTVIGPGQNLVAVPVSTNPHFNWYNEKLFKSQGINIVSVPAEELDAYNTKNGTSLKPHGYAEYKTAPVAGMTQSKNLLGQDVYKVFNNCIGMNWEEQRNILKYFSPNYNANSPTTYGFVSEYWFNYGWSVGGDVMGFNGSDYDFTLCDDSPNYIVTKDGTTVNGVTYSAGEIVRYEDRVNDKSIATKDGLYAIKSQYDAVKEYVALQVATDKTVDVRNGVTYKGYGVADPNTGKAATWFNAGLLAMTRGSDLTEQAGTATRLENPDFNICLAETYREYEGGTTYQKDGKEGFANEYLKVIGETYDDGVYTGDIKEVDGTPIIGKSTSASISKALVIPACSDPAKYEAAWNFISWVATEGQKHIVKSSAIPVAEDVLFSDAFVKSEEVSKGKNLYAVAKMSLNAGRGDWGYFEDGTWVSNWSDAFNSEVRRGTLTLTDFEGIKSGPAKTALNNMFCVTKGIR